MTAKPEMKPKSTPETEIEIEVKDSKPDAIARIKNANKFRIHIRWVLKAMMDRSNPITYTEATDKIIKFIEEEYKPVEKGVSSPIKDRIPWYVLFFAGGILGTSIGVFIQIIITYFLG